LKSDEEKELLLVARDNKSYPQKTRFRGITKAGGERNKQTNQEAVSALEITIKHRKRQEEKEEETKRLDLLERGETERKHIL